jgi:glycyl-tRNA synthetase
MAAASLDQVVSLCKRRGFIFPGSEIYGGLANTWDYGPLGAVMKENLKRHWRKQFVRNRMDMVELDSSIMMNPRTWEASGHVGGFSDPLVDCRNCKKRFRGDKLLEEEKGVEVVAGISLEEIQSMLTKEKIACPSCSACDWTDARKFNLMFKTQQGVDENDEGGLVYMRPETAQGIFVNFKNVLQTENKSLPFGIAQIGKAFRNEITPGHFTFRTREFEQMEIEYFVHLDEWEKHFDKWQKDVWDWYVDFGLHKDNIRVREHEKDELCHYSSRTVDIEYKFPWGWGELFGLAYRGDFDLKQHQECSGQDMSYTDPDDPSKKFLPHVIEPSFGLDRTILTLLIEAYAEDEVESAKGTKEKRTMLKLDPRIAPYNVAVLPLSKKGPLVKKAQEIYEMLIRETDLRVDFDITRSIGKRYRRQDEIGTPTCVTVDFGTIGEDKKQCRKDHVTVRDRDSLTQKEVKIDQLAQVLQPS